MAFSKLLHPVQVLPECRHVRFRQMAVLLTCEQHHVVEKPPFRPEKEITPSNLEQSENHC